MILTASFTVFQSVYYFQISMTPLCVVLSSRLPAISHSSDKLYYQHGRMVQINRLRHHRKPIIKPTTLRVSVVPFWRNLAVDHE